MADSKYGIVITAIDDATRVLRAVGAQIGTLQKSIRLLTGATGLGFVIQMFGMLQRAIGQNEEMSKKFSAVTEGITSMMGELLAPILENIIRLWNKFGDEAMLVIKMIAASVRLLINVFNNLMYSIIAMGKVSLKVLKGDFQGAIVDAAKFGAALVEDIANDIDAFGNLWKEYADGKILNTKKAKEETKKAADEETEIVYNSWTEFQQLQTMKQEQIDAYNKALEEKRAAAYAKQKKQEDEQAAKEEAASQKFLTDNEEAIGLLNNLVRSFQVGFGSAFQQAITGGGNFVKSMSALFKSMRDMVIRFIGEMIAKMMILFLLKQALGIFGGGGTIGGILKASIKGLTGGQTSPGQLKLIPGSRYEPVPIMAHGGEVIGRPGGGSMGGLTINVSGSLYNANETIEQIRSGLYGMRLATGRTA